MVRLRTAEGAKARIRMSSDHSPVDSSLRGSRNRLERQFGPLPGGIHSVESAFIVQKAFGLGWIPPGDIDADQLNTTVDVADLIDHRMPDHDVLRTVPGQNRLQCVITGSTSPPLGMLGKIPAVPMGTLLMPDEPGAKIGPRLGRPGRWPETDPDRLIDLIEVETQPIKLR